MTLELESPGESEENFEEVTRGGGPHGLPGSGREFAFYSKCERNPLVG